VATGTLEEMRQHIQAQRVVRVGLTARDFDELSRAVGEAQVWLAGQPDVTRVEPVAGNGEGDLQVTFAGDDESLARLLSALVGAGFPVVMFHEETGDLEDVFMRLTKGIVS